MEEKDFIDAIYRNLGKGKMLELPREDGIIDQIYIEQLPSEELGKVMKIVSAFADTKMTDVEFMASLAKGDLVSDVTYLLKRSVQLSYPSLDEKKTDSFVAANWLPLLKLVFEINSLGQAKVSSNDREAINRKARIESLRRAHESEGTPVKEAEAKTD